MNNFLRFLCTAWAISPLLTHADTAQVKASNAALTEESSQELREEGKAKLGKLNFHATKFGLGGQAAIEKWQTTDVPVAIIKKAYHLGVNYFDTSNVYDGSQLRFGIAFKELGLVPGLENYDPKKREAIFLTSKTGLRWANPHAKEEGVRAFTNGPEGSGCVDDIRRSLTQIFGDGKGNYPKGAYLDMVLLHDIGEMAEIDAVFEGLDEVARGEKPKRVGTLLALRDLRDGTNFSGYNPNNEKLIRHIGVSCHRSPAVVMELIQRDKSNLLEGLLVTINPNDNLYFSMQNNLLPVAKAKDMAVIGMKIFANGALFDRKAEWPFSAQQLTMTVGSPQLPSRSLIQYALTTPGIDIIITGISKISDDKEQCQLYQNFMDAKNSPAQLSQEKRAEIEQLTKLVKDGKTNYFQAEAVGLTPARDIHIRKQEADVVISWDNSYAGASKISHYNIICDGKKIAQVDYKPQTTSEAYIHTHKSGNISSEYQIETKDESGESIISEKVHLVK